MDRAALRARLAAIDRALLDLVSPITLKYADGVQLSEYQQLMRIRDNLIKQIESEDEHEESKSPEGQAGR